MEPVSRRQAIGIGMSGVVAAGIGAISFLATATPAGAQTTSATGTRATTVPHDRRQPGFRRGFPGADLQAIATALKLTPAQVRQQELAGKSIAQIAQAQNVPLQTVKDAISTAAKSRLDQAVSAGRLTSAQETQQLTNLQARLDSLLNNTPHTPPTGASGVHTAGRRPAWRHGPHRRPATA